MICFLQNIWSESFVRGACSKVDFNYLGDTPLVLSALWTKMEILILEISVKKNLLFNWIKSLDVAVTDYFMRPIISRGLYIFYPIIQFYIQLVYKPQFGTWILLFGPFRQLRAVRKKKWIWVFLSHFWGCFFNFLWAKKNIYKRVIM